MQHGLVNSKSSQANPDYVQIGDSSLINTRKEIAAPDPPGGTLSDYIPFYLGPRSPMLYQIATGWEDIKKYPQEEIIYYISSVEKIKQHNLKYFFSDGHARSSTSTFYTEDFDFDKLDWDTIYATYWKSDENDLRRKEKKQSELLVKEYVPFSCIQYIGVFNKKAEEKVLTSLDKVEQPIPVRINSHKLYYDNL
jgi:hypothetical protein